MGSEDLPMLVRQAREIAFTFQRLYESCHHLLLDVIATATTLPYANIVVARLGSWRTPWFYSQFLLVSECYWAIIFKSDFPVRQAHHGGYRDFI